MSQRTFSEISDDMARAREAKDADAIMQYAAEFDALGSPEALALAARSRGIVFLLGEGNTAKAMDQFRTALALHTAMNDNNGLAKSHGHIASVHVELGEYDHALEHLYRALDLYENVGDHYEIARTTRRIGRVLSSIGKDAEAFSLFHQALDTFTTLGRDRDIGLSLNMLGNLLKNSGQYPEALEQYSRSLSLFEQLDDHSGIALVTDNIGSLYYMTEDYPMAIIHRERALSYYESTGDERNIASTLANIGNIHVVKNDIDLGLEYYRRAHSISIRLGMQRDIARTTGLILGVLVRKGPSAEADELLATLDAMTIPDITDSLYKEACRAMIQEYRGEFDLARNTLLAGLAIAKERALPFEQSGFHDQLKDLALKQNDLAAYVEHNNAYQRIIEETNGKAITTRLAMQEADRRIAKERAEHEKHLSILHSTLPKHIADRVARGEQVNDHYDNAAVLFLDIVGFTTISNQLSSSEVVQLLESVFSELDAVCKKHDVVKIKTIGDSYMAVAFPTSVPHSVRNDTSVPHSTRDDTSSHDLSTEERVIPSETRNTAMRASNAALDMLHAISYIVSPASSPASSPTGSPASSPLQVRIGMHCGPVTAGVIGTERMQYDVWGDTVNVASRMENTSEPGRIHVSETFANALKTSPPAPLSSVRGDTSSEYSVPSSLIPRGEIEIKGKGSMATYWLLRDR